MAQPWVKILPMVFTRWNKFRSLTKKTTQIFCLFHACNPFWEELYQNPVQFFSIIRLGVPLPYNNTLLYYIKHEKCKVNDVIFPSGCEALQLTKTTRTWNRYFHWWYQHKIKKYFHCYFTISYRKAWNNIQHWLRFSRCSLPFKERNHHFVQHLIYHLQNLMLLIFVDAKSLSTDKRGKRWKFRFVEKQLKVVWFNCFVWCLCWSRHYFSYIAVTSAPIHASPKFFKLMLCKIFLPNYWLLSHITNVETMDSHERRISHVAMTKVNPWKECWPSCRLERGISC